MGMRPPGLRSKFSDSQSYIGRPCLKQNNSSSSSNKNVCRKNTKVAVGKMAVVMAS